MASIKFKAFLDTNVLLDVLCGAPRPSAAASLLIFQAVRSGLMEAVITTQSIVDASYILSHGNHFDAALFRKAILSMMNYMNIRYIDVFDLQDASIHPSSDFEDDVQLAHAEAEGCDAMITSDRKLRQRSNDTGMLFLTPEAFVARLRRPCD